MLRPTSLPSLLLPLLFAACSAPAFEAGRVPHGSLEKRGEVWVMTLDGTPAERGKAAGELVGEQIRWALPRYLDATLHTKKPEGPPLALARVLAPHIPKPHLTQLDALARAAGIDRDTLLVVNLAPEIYAGLAGCSCMGVAKEKSADQTLRLGRNLDWYGGDVLKDLGLVVIERVGEGRLASVTWPGLVGVVTGMNEAGLSVANLVVLGQHATVQPGVPVMFALRQILEAESSVEAASGWLEAQPRTVPQNYAMADPNEIVVLETWVKRFRRRVPDDGFVAVGNLFDEDQHAHPRGRYVRMMHTGQRKTLSLKQLQTGLWDVALDQMNVQAVVFEPGHRKLYGSTAARPAATGPYWELSPFAQ